MSKDDDSDRKAAAGCLMIVGIALCGVGSGIIWGQGAGYLVAGTLCVVMIAVDMARGKL